MNTKLLRQKILDLAIRGKLTDQRKSDGTARELLEQISASRQPERSTKSAKSKDPTPIIPLNKSEAPFEIPNSWEWIKLGDVGNWQSGTTPSKSNLDYYRNGTIPWLNTGDLNDGIVSQIPKMVTEKALKETSLRMNDAGSVCIAMYGATIGKLGILPIPATTNQACCVCNKQANFVKRMWLFYFLMFHKQEFIEAGFGGAQPNISKEKIVSTAFPLPPLTEQQRIIAKIEEAFAEIDAVEKNKELLKTHIKQTRQKILDLAIHGKLVPQDKNDEPASVLLEKILQEKVQSDNKKSPKKKKTDDVATSDNRPYEKITVEDEPFEIPSSWEWVKLKSICEDFIVPQRDKPTEFTGTIPWCRIEDIEGKYLNGSKSHQLVTKELADKMNMHLCPKGTVISACSASIGNQAITTVDCYTNQTFIGIVCNKALLFNEYLYYFLASQSKTLKDMGKGTTIGYISRKKYEDYAFPLPPLTEQKRIVDKIEEIFRSLDEISLHLV